MSRLLIYPPFADPTQPYLSLPTLKGHLRSKGLDARVLDLNIEAVHHLLGSEELEALARKIGRRFVELNRRKELSFDAEREYVALADARAGIGDLLAAEPPPIDVFRTREHFFDAPLYTQARRRMEAFFQALGAAHFPYRYGFNRAGHEVLPWSFDLLEEYCAEARSPLDRFYRKVLDPLPDWDPAEEGIGGIFLDDLEFAGISIVFPSQVPEALYLARFLRAHAPGAFIALGGPCLHQIAHGMDPGRLRRLLGFADGLCLFEGEETLVRLFPLLPAWRDASEPTARSAILSDVPNLLLADPASGETRLGPRSAVDLETAAPPDWSDLDLDRYLAPSRILLFAPTRGCYWNRCSFCRYGLSETATAAYREVPPERSAAQIAKLSKRHGVRNFYISCDVLSPSYALRFAQALIDRGLKIRWSSDLKPEKYFTPERCEVLQRSGLRSAAFGVESGSDRVLGLSPRATMWLL